ncbi:unnamed protein product [Prunus armeniaca]
MTYNSALFSTTIPPHCDHVLIVNNVVAPIMEASSILLTLVLLLDKVLLVQSLSNNLLAMPQVTEQLNCVVLMYSSFILLRDIQIQKIFGRGTKKEGLYYVDDVATSWVLRAGRAETSQHCQIWLLHSRFVMSTSLLFNVKLVFYLRVIEYPTFQGILYETTCPQTPQQNRVAERRNRHILAAARALLLGASVPKLLWIDAVTLCSLSLESSTFTSFGFPNSYASTDPSSLYLFYVDFVSKSVWLCHLCSPPSESEELDPCALCCFFMGFSSHQKGYRCYHPATRRLYVSMNVTFIEDEMFFSDTPEHILQDETSSGGHNWLDLQGGVVLDSLIQREEPTEHVEPAEPDTQAEPATLAEPAILIDVTIVTEPIAPHEASLIVPDQAPMDNLEVSASIHTADNSYVLPPRRNRGVPPDHNSPEGKARYAIAYYVSDHMLSHECKAFVTKMDSIKISTCVKETFNNPKWREAMNIEMEALQKNNT